MDQELAAAIERNNVLLERQLRQQTDWKVPFRNGVLAGVGSVLGATLVISTLVWTLQPFKGIGPLKPTLDRLTDALEKNDRKR